MSRGVSTSNKCGRLVGRVATLACLLTLLGCNSGPNRIPAPDVSPADLTERLIEDFDANGNGALSTEELKNAPSLVAMFNSYDDDKSKELSADELEGGLARIFDGKGGITSATCRVTRDGKPVSGATVYYVPEPFLEGVLAVAGGITAADGIADLSVREEDLPPNAPKERGLMQPGLYFIEVTHPTVKIPENYNKETTLGSAVCGDVTIKGPIHLALKF
jgi:hypothetical protein